jgi:hypothetical protein
LQSDGSEVVADTPNGITAGNDQVCVNHYWLLYDYLKLNS